MSTIVCQSVASSCLESQLTETTTTTLKLKVAPPPAAADYDRPTNLEFGNWGFLQTTPRESAYCFYRERNHTNPWEYKSPFSTLSAKSLELCTENLGSETGTDIITGAAIFSSPSPPLTTTPAGDYSSSGAEKAETDGTVNRKQKSNSPGGCRSFPPPLTTMSGSSSLQVRRHREGGRLIIEAVEAPFRNSYLQVERSDGRLRLSYLTAEATTSAGGGGEEDELDGETAAEEEEEEIEEGRSELGSELDDEFEFDDEINNNNNKNKNRNLEMEMEKFQWVSRCKEEGGHGNKGLCSNWKPALWVAIS